jgi:hypothetical protein
MNNKIVISAVIGLIAGLVLGVFIGVMFISPSGILPIKSGAGTNNQVQVSGTIQQLQIFGIKFVSIPDGNISTTSPLYNGGYKALLIGGQSYNVYLLNQYGGIDYAFSLYVPLGVTTFTANF